MESCKRINLIKQIFEPAGRGPSSGNNASSTLPTIQIEEWVSRRRPNELREEAVTELKSASGRQRVGLKNLGLRELPPDQLVIYGTSKAKDLSLAHNDLERFPEVVLNLSNLETLSISHNMLRKFPRGIDNLKNLRSLNLSKNAIGTIPDAIGALTKLKSLDVSSNSLRYVSDKIGDLGRLQTLSLNENLLKEITSEVRKLTKLEKLNLARNRLTRLPEEVGSLTKLEKLNVADNQLSGDDAIPSSVARLETLKELDVSGNPLAWLHVDFGPFQYASKSKLTIARQRTGYEVPWGKLTISIANTYLPNELAPARLGRLPDPGYQGPTFKKPYTGPVLGERAPQPEHQRTQEIPRDRSGHKDDPHYGHYGDKGPELSPEREGAWHLEQQKRQVNPRARDRSSHRDRYHDDRSSVRSGSTFEFVDGTPPRSHRNKQGFRRDSDGESSHRSDRKPGRHNHEYSDRSVSSREDRHDPWSHGKAPMDGFQHYGPRGNAEGQDAYGGPPPAPFKQVAFQGIPYRQGLAQGGEYHSVGEQWAGVTGPAVVPQTTPVLHALLAKIHEATQAAHAAPPQTGMYSNRPMPGAGLPPQYEPRPPLQRAYGRTLQEEVVERGTLFDYQTVPLYGDHMAHQAIMGLNVERRHADGLRALKSRYPIRTEGDTLDHYVNLAKNMKTTYDDLLGIARMMYRQEVINGLAERVAEANRQDNQSNIDKTAPYQVEDPHVIALVYQVIVARECHILPVKDVHHQLVTNDAFKAVFASVIVPGELENVKEMVQKAVWDEECKEAQFDDFLNRQPFWIAYRNEHAKNSLLHWNAKYPKSY